MWQLCSTIVLKAVLKSLYEQPDIGVPALWVGESQMAYLCDSIHSGPNIEVQVLMVLQCVFFYPAMLTALPL